jgi:hypothetical protein
MIMSGCTRETAVKNVWNCYCELAIEKSPQVPPKMCKAPPETHSPRCPISHTTYHVVKRDARDIAKAAMHRAWDE